MRERDDAAGALLQGHDVCLRDAALLLREGAKGDDLFGAALGVDDVAVPLFDTRGHVFGIRREGIQLADLRLFAKILVVDAALFRRNEQRALGGVADEADDVVLVIQICRAVEAVVFEHDPVAEGIFLDEPAARPYVDDGHAVFGKGARLIRTDDVDAADGFAGDHLFDERVLPRHARDVDGEGDGDDGRQTLRHRRDHQHDAGDERFGDGFEGCGARGEHEDELDDEDERREHRADDGDDLAQASHLLLQGSLPLAAALNFARDQPELRKVADVRHDHLARTACDEAAGIHHIDPLGDGRAFGKDGVRILFDGCRFAREGRFVAHQRNALDEPAVGSDLVARFEEHDVAHDQLLLRNVLHHAVPHDLDLDALFDLVQFVERLGAAPLHDDREHDRNEYGDEDARAFRPVEVFALRYVDDVHGNGDRPRTEEQDEHRLGSRFPDTAKKRFPPRFCELVSAVPFAVFFDLMFRQTLMRVCLQTFENLLRRLVVRLHTYLHGTCSQIFF